MTPPANMSTRVVFMGTPDFAVPTLTALIDAPQFSVVGVVTQPDRPAGRGRSVQPSPIKRVALAHDRPTIQPANLRKEPEAVEQIRAWEPDFLVVVAFGQILRQEVLDIPRIMPVNVHASLLPRWRGAAPIQAAIRAGDHYTGITTMQMDAGMDTGPILLQDSIPISPRETGESLHDKLAVLGANLLLHTLDWLVADSIAPHPQPEDDALISYAPMLKKADGEIDWTNNTAAIDRQVRAYTPWPGTYTTWQGKTLKILEGVVVEDGPRLAHNHPGDIIESGTEDSVVRPFAVQTGSGVYRFVDHPQNGAIHLPFVVQTGSGFYAPTRLQLAGRQAVSADDFLNGAPDFIGSTLGNQS